MSLQIRYNSATEVADVVTVRMGVSFSMAAEEGAVAQSQIVVDDTGSTLNYKGLRRLYAYETAAQAHNQMVFNGYLQERTIGRQPAEGQDQDEAITALDRRWNLTVADTNSLMSRRLITGPDGDRPAETDIARIQWLLDSNDAYLSNPQDTWTNPSPYIDTAGPIDMDAADLRGQTAFDVLNDCAQRSGKLWFAQYYEANDTVPPTNNGSIALHYYPTGSTYYSSTLKLSNVTGDADNITTFYVLPDALLSRDPSRAYSGVYLTYDGGSTYQQSTQAENLFQRRDAAVSNPNIKTAAKATALATRYLFETRSEDDRITCRFVVAKQYVNDLREGQRLQVKFSHLPGYTAYSYVRCLRRTVTQLNDDFYEIAVELSPQSGCTPAPLQQGEFLYPSGAHATEFQMPFTPAAGSFLLAYIGYRLHAWATPAGWTLHDQRTSGDDVTGWAWKIADGTEVYFDTGYSTNKYGYVYSLSCASGAQSLTSTFTNGTGNQMTASAVSAPGPGIVLGGLAVSGGPDNADHRAGGAYPVVVPGSGYTLVWTGQEEYHPMMSIVSKSISGAGSHTPSGYKDGNAAPWVYNTGSWQFIAWAIAITE